MNNTEKLSIEKLREAKSWLIEMFKGDPNCIGIEIGYQCLVVRLKLKDGKYPIRVDGVPVEVKVVGRIERRNKTKKS
jgi:hypothetical protein